MWQPQPGWRRLSGGRGALTVGVWLASAGGLDWVVKRIRVPGPDDPAVLRQPDHPGYWRRELAFALDGPVTSGLVAPEVRQADEDEQGYAVWSRWIPPTGVTGLLGARALGRFAAGEVAERLWWSRRLLSRRVDITAARGGWSSLARTPLARLAEELWSRRDVLLARYDALPQHLAHGDPAAANLLAARGPDVVTIDWSQVGLAPLGADLGYHALGCREDFEPLLAGYLAGAAEAGAAPDEEQAAFAARLMLVFTAMARADWVLSRAVAHGGEVGDTFRHPSVAPYLRALQRHLPQVEAVLAAR